MPTDRKTFRDQMGRDVEVAFPPQRIVSLVPSQTELLFDLGVGDRVVGATRFCTRPAEALAGIARVGGTKQISAAKIEAVAPDLLIGNKEENERVQIESLAERWPVWLSDVDTIESALTMIEHIGALVGAEAAAVSLAHEIRTAFGGLPEAGGVRVAYLIWRRPWMGAAGGTFIDDVLHRCGFVNVLAEQGLDRYPEVELDALCELQPDFVFLSSEPFPFSSKHVPEMEAGVPGTKAVLVDGEAFSWFGSRLRPSVDVLAELVRDCSRRTGGSPIGSHR